MSTEGWIFMVGFRVFDVGLLVLWLIWFFRLRDDDSGPPDEGGQDDDGGGPRLDPPDPSGGGGLGLILPGSLRSEKRMRDHASPPARRRSRTARPHTHPAPARVRRPARRPSPVV